ncbi:MAG: serine/threonine-protein phosphatase [Desulfobacterales bacterium]|nr:serine/threonine-protein phosphatase [Desulfobacterales bacterium]
MAVIESAGITDVGKKRKGNEDALYIDDEQMLYVVSDGMGGHQAGEVASMLVVETIRDYMKRFKQEDEANVEELVEADESLSKEANRLISGIRLANQGVHHVAQSKESYRGMGATVSAVYFTDGELIAVNVGDSPIYLIHNGQIELLSVTHNVITEQAAIDPEAARNIGAQFKHMLTRAMGIEETVKPDVSEIPYFKGDKLVISSDGLSDKVPPEEILEIVKQEKPERACQKLVDLANARGGDDNITIIILNVKSVKQNVGGVIGALSKLFTPFKRIFN